MDDHPCTLAELIFAGLVTVAAGFALGGAVGAAVIHYLTRRTHA